MEENQIKGTLSVGKSILAVAAVVAAVVLVTAVVLNNQKPAVAEETETIVQVEEPTEQTEETAAPTEASEPEETTASVDEAAAAATMEAEAAAEEVVVPEPTVPADGNPDDVTCKGTYTAADDAVIAARDTVAATAGDEVLTVGQLQTYYWMEVMNFLNRYGAYAAYFGLDYQQSLDTQLCPMGDPQMTWQQYFLDVALHTWQSYRAMSLEGAANGFALPEEQVQELENLVAEMEATAQAYGMASASDLLHQSLGAAANVDDYRYFTELYYKANGYYTQVYNQIEVTDDQLETYFETNAERFAQSGITKDTRYVDVRHILVYPEGADGTNIFTETFSEEAWAAGEAAAQKILDAWLAGEKTEESFAALANEHSQDPGSNKNGGLYEGVKEGEMVAAFNDWCFDAGRQIGDSGIVKTEYGYHVMFFSGSQTVWQDAAKSEYLGETASAQVTAIAEKYPLTVNYADILLATVNLA